MPKGMTELRHKYLRHHKKFPHVWCSGCGNGIILGALIRAIERLKLKKDDIVLASGIGCSGRMPTYVDFNTVHTTHGRALTFATGIKLAKPSLNVIAVMGDGDATAIGGNHFIHAARRNLDLTAIIINNQIYGMTGGQASPTTPYGANSTTSSFSNIEHAFSIAELAVAAGASFVARGTVYHAAQLDKLIEKGIRKNGFSVVEIMSNCHVQFGRRNNMGDPVTMLNWFKEHAISKVNGSSIPPDSLDDNFTIGILADVDKPDYIAEYQKIRQMAKGK
ncbi:MAG: 2-oxoacid:ferredoxin oxidoreductase subunit beta [Desulfobacterales bacterium]|nr:2-oxoacid:ferredoxin oxidoreductase subunit beta [Desulfobacterales bacterium]